MSELTRADLGVLPEPVSYFARPGVSDQPAKADHVHEIRVEDWQYPDLQNGWTPSATIQPIRFCLDPSGFVHIEGSLNAGTVAAGTDLWYMPVGYRPENSLRVVCSMNSGAGITTIVIASAGTVEIGPNAVVGSLSIVTSYQANRQIPDANRL